MRQTRIYNSSSNLTTAVTFLLTSCANSLIYLGNSSRQMFIHSKHWTQHFKEFKLHCYSCKVIWSPSSAGYLASIPSWFLSLYYSSAFPPLIWCSGPVYSAFTLTEVGPAIFILLGRRDGKRRKEQRGFNYILAPSLTCCNLVLKEVFWGGFCFVFTADTK